MLGAVERRPSGADFSAGYGGAPLCGGSPMIFVVVVIARVFVGKFRASDVFRGVLQQDGDCSCERAWSCFEKVGQAVTMFL